MFAQVHDGMGGEAFPDPEVMGQVRVGGGQIWAVVIERGVAVVTAAGLQQHQHRSKPQAADREAIGAQAGIVLRGAPLGFDQAAGPLRQLFIPALVILQGQGGQGGQVPTFGIRRAPLGEAAD